ncbi:helix-turn-helix domain-containing protein [Sphingomonas sp.]|uniref:winged helix-turn-helix transcriptional regulator n=1 Tax=Sphingomonas sp. TaxID=28214 RepID=UPI00307D763C
MSERLRMADMLARGDVFAPDCPARTILRQVTSSWGLLVLVALQPGTLRFSALRRRISGISERMLAQTLQQLESYRLVTRHSPPVVPPHVEYSLTPLGIETARRAEDLVEWIQTHLVDMLAGPGEVTDLDRAPR